MKPGSGPTGIPEGPAGVPAPPASAGSAAAGCDGTLGAADLAPPAFQRAVLGQLVAVPDLAAASRGPFLIRVAFAGRSYDVRLDEMYKRYRHGDVTVSGAAEEIKAAVGVPGAAVRAAGPYPRLARRADLAPGLATWPCPFDNDLVVFFVRTLPVGHVPIPAQDVADGAALYGEALAQLRALTHATPGQADGEGAAMVLRYEAGDGLDAGRALLPDLMAAMADLVQGQPLVALPSRDLLVMVGNADADVVARARAMVAERHAQDPFPLSPRWYTVAPDGDLSALAS